MADLLLPNSFGAIDHQPGFFAAGLGWRIARAGMRLRFHVLVSPLDTRSH
jgi:hypothetical protein